MSQQQNNGQDSQRLWYKDAVIYELHIKAFHDSDGDGIGDFKGLLEKLDYLQDLGATAIWVLPFYPSPLKDDGYDIADYYSINPSYGNLEDFKRFLEEAHRRGLKVITELVINHTSDQHPWFQRARRAPKGSPERDFYVWTDDPQLYKDVRIIFQDFEASNWTWDPVAGQYYWHRFFHHQPDLNYDNPLVQEEVFRIIDYWCAMGVDGFRLDAVPYLYEREGTNGENLPETHVYLKRLRAHVEERYPNTCFLAEANMWPEDSASYFGNGDECHMNYHFPVMPRMFMALQMEDRYPITDIFDQTPEIPESCQWAIFLRNHDELTLEMVTDEERDYMYKVYAKDPKARINLGIRHRLAPLMDNSRARIELMNSLLFSLPGTPVLYYGDEIGMGDNFYLGDRDGVRTPMQWSADRNAGFSKANPHRLYLPVILDPEYHYESVNVELQRRNTSSLFWFMKRIINMRKQYKAFSRGRMKFIHVENPKVLCFVRSFEDETILVVVNLSKFSQPAEIDLSDFNGYTPVEVFSKNRFPVVREDRPYFFTLGPHSFQWFLLEKAAQEPGAPGGLPHLEAAGWTELLQGTGRQSVERLLPAYLARMNWFVSRRRTVHSLSISGVADLPGLPAALVLVDVVYESGLPETYQLPLAFVSGSKANTLRNSCPQAVLATLQLGSEDGLLCDAFYTPETQKALLHLMGGAERLPHAKGAVVGTGSEALAQHLATSEEVRPRVQDGETAHTAIAYDNRFFLKLYRKVDAGINPDLELTRFLAEQGSFAYTPAFTGALEWQAEGGAPTVLGMLQVMVENHGDARSYMFERLHNYIERILARDRASLHPEVRTGSLAEPVSFDSLPEDLQELLGARAAEQARLIGIRTAELHLALASAGGRKEFEPEDFSLHYQRSLFSALQSVVRETFQQLERNGNQLPPSIRDEVLLLQGERQAILDRMKRIYDQKLDTLKIRIHGNYGLPQVLLTGKDVAIHAFTGDPSRPYTERRLKRSPLRDVASMIRSFYVTAFEGFFTTVHVPQEDVEALLPFAGLWAHYMSGFFTRAYLQVAEGSGLVPLQAKDRALLLHTFLMEQSLSLLNHELRQPSRQALVPLRLLQRVLEEGGEQENKRTRNEE